MKEARMTATATVRCYLGSDLVKRWATGCNRRSRGSIPTEFTPHAEDERLSVARLRSQRVRAVMADIVVTASNQHVAGAAHGHTRCPIRSTIVPGVAAHGRGPHDPALADLQNVDIVSASSHDAAIPDAQDAFKRTSHERIPACIDRYTSTHCAAQYGLAARAIDDFSTAAICRATPGAAGTGLCVGTVTAAEVRVAGKEVAHGDGSVVTPTPQ